MTIINDIQTSPTIMNASPTRWVRDLRTFFRGFAVSAVFWGLVFVAWTHL